MQLLTCPGSNPDGCVSQDRQEGMFFWIGTSRLVSDGVPGEPKAADAEWHTGWHTENSTKRKSPE